MSFTTRYRRRLLHAVEAFMEQSPNSVKHGRRIVKWCDTALHRPEKLFTIDDLVWGNITMLLSDSIFYTDQTYLLRLQAILSGRSWIQEQTYISFDFVNYSFSEIDRGIYDQLLALVDLLRTARFSPKGNALDRYLQGIADVQAVAAHIQPPQEIGDDKIYHVVLREVLAFVTNVDAVRSQRLGRIALAPGYYGVISERDDPPDIASGVVWADRALLALAARDWLLVTWVIRTDLLLFSLR